MIADLAHADHPFDRLVNDIGAARPAGVPPLVQAMLVYQGPPPAPQPGLEPVDVPQPWTHVDLTLDLTESDGALSGWLEYDSALFDASTVQALADGLTRLLDHGVRRPEKRLASFPMMDAQAAQEAARAANGPNRTWAATAGLHQAIVTAAQRSPDAIAVADEDGSLSYRLLLQRAAGISAQLAELQVGAESCVGILMRRSAWLPIAMLGVLHRGAAVVPLDPSDPPERLAWLIRDAGITVVLTSESADAEAVTGAGAGYLDVTTGASKGSTMAMPGPTAVHPDQASAVLYTSGSTGEPKAVILTHSGLLNRMHWMQDAFDITATDRILHKTPITFDVALWELLLPMMVGACVQIAPPGWHREPGLLAELMETQQVTVTHFVPTMLTAFLDATSSAPPSLRLVVASGETLTSRLRDAVHRRYEADLVNLYGPTEASIDVTAWHCARSDAGEPPIGTPIANVRVSVLGTGDEPVPVNAPGEIWIGGDAPARGYLGRPGVTAASFRPDPADPGGRRRYGTGDRARRRADGALMFLGRTDEQVKISGLRVEPGEIEAALSQLPGVAAAGVGVHHDSGGPRLFACVVASEPAQPPDTGELRRLLSTKLPPALVPAAFTLVADLPTTSSGKLNRRALPPPVFAAPTQSAAKTPSEQRIAAVWTQVLGAEDIDLDTNFFALGGDSIRAVRLAAALHTEGFAVTVAELIAAGTVRGIAALADTRHERQVPDGTLGEELAPEPFALCPPAAVLDLPVDVVDAYPVSTAQRALLFQQDTNPGHEVYVTSVMVSGVLDLVALESAIEAAFQRHPYLRSSFDLGTTVQPLQRVHRRLSSAPVIVDLRDLEPTAADQAHENWLARERIRKFDVTTGPLARFTVHHRTDSTFQLSLSSFALDGWCTASVLTEVLCDHAARLSGETLDVSAPGCGYSVFVAAEQRAMKDPAHREFWASRLEDAPACLVGQPTPASAASLTRRVLRAVDPDISSGLRTLAIDLEVSLKSVLLAAHLRVIRTFTRQSEVLTGLEVNGRPAVEDGDRTVGVFNNIVPLRADLSSGTWADLIAAAASAELDLLPYRRYPFAELEREHQVREKFDSLFVYTDFHVYRALDRHGVKLLGIVAPDRTYVPLTLHVNADSASGGLRVLVDYEPNAVSRERAEAMAEAYLRALEVLLKHPYRSHAAHSLLPVAEESALISAGVSPRAAHTEGTVDGLILKQIARTPHAIAVTCGEHALSYGQLGERSRLLANALIGAGAQPDQAVAVPGTRGIALVVGLLAVLRAGAGYLPVDLADPPEHRDRVLAAAGVRLIAGPGPEGFVTPPGCRVVTVDEAMNTGPPARHPSALAYALFTSGSSGEAKLIGVPHSAVVNYLQWCAREYRPSAGSRTPVHSPSGFDLTVTSLLVPLVTGGCIDLLPAEAEPEALGAAIAAGADGILKITPRHLEALSEQLRFAGGPSCLTTVIVGGEQVHAQQASGWPNATVINEYGPTEATVGCCTHVIEPGVDRGVVPIGRPIDGTGAHLLDDGHPVPLNVVAELSIAGAGLARGYLGRPADTAAAFVPGPHGHGERLYRTGDLARRDADGVLHLVGRQDRQVKIRGHRVEPGYVEGALSAHPAVRSCAVIARTDQSGLVAYWVPSHDSVEPSELAAWLADRLPAVMVPQVFLALPALPLTRRGKVDLSALPDPRADRRQALLELVEGLSADAVLALLAAEQHAGGRT